MKGDVGSYDFFSPQHIRFGWERFPEVGSLARRLGRRAFVVVGSRTLATSGVIAELERLLTAANVFPVMHATIEHEPEVADVDAATAKLHEEGIRDGDFVIGIGGGSAIDLAKALAAIATNSHGDSVRDFLEGVGKGLTIDSPPLPMLAIPTTAGTGSEATKNAVISSYDPAFKQSLRSDHMIPDCVLIDPQLAVSVPPTTTAFTGMDAITQLIESYVSCRSKPIPRALCVDGLSRAVPAIQQAVEDGNNRPAREAMAQAALLSGLALANSGLGLAHGVAPALGIHCRVPHGLACAVMLPVAMAVNREFIAPLSPVLTGLSERELPTNADEQASLAIDAIRSLVASVGIPASLSEIGVTADQVPAIVKSSYGNSMRGNPIEVAPERLTGLLERML